MRTRTILHVDMNAFYASVEQHRNPRLRGLPIAVAGDPEQRHGIILAKSREAKACGVKTAEAIWQAKQKCPDLILVKPDYAAYMRYSRLARQIYYQYSDLVEPFGLDESWVDITHTLPLHGGDPMVVAQEISERVKAELGLTVSVGVSFNKVFAKFGSDTDASDGILHIPRNRFQDIVWPADVGDLLYVGRATSAKLKAAGINTIGDLAHASDYFLEHRLGKMGLLVKEFANGRDESSVKVMNPRKTDVDYAIKSIGNGLTAPHALKDVREAKALTFLLAESVAQRLRECRFRAKTVAISIRNDRDLGFYTRQTPLVHASCATEAIANTAWSLIRANEEFDGTNPVRALGVRACNLVPADLPMQTCIFGDVEKDLAHERLDCAIDDLRRRFGNNSVRRLVELSDESTAGLDIKRDNVVHPVGFLAPAAEAYAL